MKGYLLIKKWWTDPIYQRQLSLFSENSMRSLIFCGREKNVIILKVKKRL